MYRKVKLERERWRAERATSFFVHFELFSWLKPHVKCCSIHISQFLIQGLGLCIKCELLSAICLCKYVLANTFGSLYFAIVLRC